MPAPINLNRFDLVSLRLFVAAVDGGSLTSGAERFGISVAAASKRIAELEAHVGSPLLVRSKRGVIPTAAGQTLLQHAAEIVAGLEQLALAMDDFRHGAGGHLRLWANPSAFAGFLPRLLADYLAKYPKVVIDLEETLSHEAVRAVARGGAELAIIGGNTPADELQTFVCDIDELVLLLPTSHPLAKRPTVDIETALALDLVGLSRVTSLMRQIASTSETLGRTLKIRVQVRNFDAVCRMVSAGIGAAIVPRAAGAPHLTSMGLAMTQLSGMNTERRLLIAMRDRSTLSSPAQAFVEMAEQRIAAVKLF
ncbi:MAG: LysR family transcriptional regulator [Betaproteobacteria bacterium]